MTLDGVELLTLAPSERARHGLFLALQQPIELHGVRAADLLVAAGVNPSTVDDQLRLEAQRVATH